MAAPPIPPRIWVTNYGGSTGLSLDRGRVATHPETGLFRGARFDPVQPFRLRLGSAGSRRKRSFIGTSIASRPRPPPAEYARFTDANWMTPRELDDPRSMRYIETNTGTGICEQGSRRASEQKFPQPRVTISSKYEQIRSALHGATEDHLRGRRAFRHHAFHVKMHAMPRQLQGDIGTGLLAVSAASGRIHD